MSSPKTLNLTALLIGLVPVAAVGVLWQWAGARSPSAHFFFSSPSDVIVAFVTGVRSGSLVLDFLYTSFPTVVGFAVGVTCGTLAGFLILASRTVAVALEWHVLILGSIPIFAIAPMMIVWFGIGLNMKIAMAILSTFFVALSQSFRGGRSIPVELRQLCISNGAGEVTLFRTLVLPMSLDWVFASLRLNASLALLGVFVGEYMASERGLGHSMLQAGALYRVSDVLACALGMILLVVILDRSLAALERRRYRLIQWFAVDARVLRQD
jgi:NitT/TauT family transport system permease protein